MRLLTAWGINAAALWVADVLFSGVRIHGWWAYIIGSAVLGIANSVIKPLLALLTLPLIIITLGFFLLLINIAMVALAEWIAPNFSIDGFWWPFFGSALLPGRELGEVGLGDEARIGVARQLAHFLRRLHEAEVEYE